MNISHLPKTDTRNVPSPQTIVDPVIKLDRADPAIIARIALLPRHLVVAIVIVGLFSLVVALIAAQIGTPISLPTERVSRVLGITTAIPIGLAIGSYLVTQYLLIRWGRIEQSINSISRNIGNDLTLLGLFLLANYLHFNLKMWVPLVNPTLHDAAYMWTDEQLRVLVDICTMVSSKIRSFLPDDVRWYQMNFIVMFILIFCRFSATRHRYYNHFAVSMLLMVTLGALSYLIAPALGPFIYESGISPTSTSAQAHMYGAYTALITSGIPWLKRYGSEYFTAALAAMPSLHIGYSILMTYYMVKARDLLAPFFVVLTLWIFIDSIALRWHYVVDAPAGIVLCAFVIWLTYRLLGRPEPAQGREFAPAPASRS